VWQVVVLLVDHHLLLVGLLLQQEVLQLVVLLWADLLLVLLHWQVGLLLLPVGQELAVAVPSLVMGDGGSKISKQTDHSKPSISLISFRHKPNFPNTNLERLVLAHLSMEPAVVAVASAHACGGVGTGRRHVLG
jgi:hypothetical protein